MCVCAFIHYSLCKESKITFNALYASPTHQPPKMFRVSFGQPTQTRDETKVIPTHSFDFAREREREKESRSRRRVVNRTASATVSASLFCEEYAESYGVVREKKRFFSTKKRREKKRDKRLHKKPYINESVSKP